MRCKVYCRGEFLRGCAVYRAGVRVLAGFNTVSTVLQQRFPHKPLTAAETPDAHSSAPKSLLAIIVYSSKCLPPKTSDWSRRTAFGQQTKRLRVAGALYGSTVVRAGLCFRQPCRAAGLTNKFGGQCNGSPAEGSGCQTLPQPFQGLHQWHLARAWRDVPPSLCG